MSKGTSDLFISGLLQDLGAGKHGSSGTDDEDRNDEHADENEASVRDHDENTEAPEEFSVDE